MPMGKTDQHFNIHRATTQTLPKLIMMWKNISLIYLCLLNDHDFVCMWIVSICIWYESYCGLYGVVCPLLAPRWPPLPDSTLTNIGSHYRGAHLNIPTWAKAIHARTIPTSLPAAPDNKPAPDKRLNWAAWERSGESAITISSSSSSGISSVVEEEARAHSSSGCQLFFCIVRACVLVACVSVVHSFVLVACCLRVVLVTCASGAVVTV